MAYAIAIFVGGVLGAASESVFGLFVGGLLGWLLVRVSRLQRDINALRASLGEARVADAAPAAAASVATAEPGVAAPTVAASEAATEIALASAPHADPIERPLAEAAAAVATSASIEAPIPPLAALDAAKRAGPDARAVARDAGSAGPARAPGDSCEAFAPRDGAPMAAGRQHHRQAGVGILFIGLAFLAQYASEHVEFPVEFRLAARHRRGGRGAAGAGLAAAPQAGRLRAGAAGRRGGGAVPDAVRRVQVLRRAAGRAGVRPDGGWWPRWPPRSRCCRTRGRWR